MTDTTLYQIEEGWIETFTGIRFYFMDPKPEMFSIVDIAHSLAMQVRYNGHVKAHYSVAEHCVLMSDWLRDHGYDRLTCLTALLHDVAETYIGDMPRPVKEKVPEFKAIEKVIDAAAADKFRIIYPFPKIVKELDARILKDERAQAMPKSDNEWGTDSLEEMGVRVKLWDWKTAESQFLGRYVALTRA